MPSVDPPTLPGSPRSRAPTITIDTSAEAAITETTIESHVETRESSSESSSFESRPTSPHNVSSPVSRGGYGGFLAVPGSRARARQNSIENGDAFKHESHPTVTEGTLNEDALRPDPGSEKDFEVNDNTFAFSPGQLNKLLDPMSFSAFYALGGLSGLEKGLRSDRRAGLSVDEPGLEGSASFEAPVHELNGKDKPPSNASNKQNKKLQESSFTSRKKVPGENKAPSKQPKSTWKLMWTAFNDKVLISLTVAATVSLALGLYETFCSLDSSKPEWIEGAAIFLAIFIVVGVETLNGHMKEKAFTRLNTNKDDSTQAGEVPIVDGIHVEGISGHNRKCHKSYNGGESNHQTKIGDKDAIRRPSSPPSPCNGGSLARAPRSTAPSSRLTTRCKEKFKKICCRITSATDPAKSKKISRWHSWRNMFVTGELKCWDRFIHPGHVFVADFGTCLVTSEGIHSQHREDMQRVRGDPHIFSRTGSGRAAPVTGDGNGDCGCLVGIAGNRVERKPPLNLVDCNTHSDLRGAGHVTARSPLAVRMVTGDNTETPRVIAAKCGILRPGGVVMDGPTFRKLSKTQMDQVTSRLQVLALSSPEDKRILVRKLQRLGGTDVVTIDDSLKETETGFSLGIAGTEVANDASSTILTDDNFGSIVKALMWGRAVDNAVKKFLRFPLAINITAVMLGFIDAVPSRLRTTILNTVQLLWINKIMDTMAALALAMESLFATDSETKSKSYELVDSAKRNCNPVSTRHKVLRQPKTPAMSQRVFVALGGLALFGPLVAATFTESSSSNWSVTIISTTVVVTTSKAIATATSIAGGSQGPDTQPGKGREIPPREEWLKSLAPLHNILWAIAITVVAFAIFHKFCESRSRRIDKARKLCFFWMVVFQALFFSVRDDPDSPPGFLFGLSIASGLFTYKSAVRGAARFDFGLFYALTGIVIGVVISFITLPFIRTKSGNPSWETILFPSIAVAFLALEIGSQCFLANMNFGDEYEVDDEAENGNGLPIYRDRYGRPILRAQNTRLEGSHQWQASQISRAGSTRQSGEQHGLEQAGTYPQTQGIPQSVDLPHPDSFLPANDDSRSVADDFVPPHNPWASHDESPHVNGS
ncbi:hypothetical protein BKA61DRAFT_573481 [Leptodontidium sp. MPI-SDFR-AT-0119]|nr:hypothetical protein BKA61DRAFT_573481 [Leptodontidium sp. MPI-SDFR-AT-0119]